MHTLRLPLRQQTKRTYQAPTVEIISLQAPDIITTSGEKDDNIGEWDPQPWSVTIQ